MSIVVQRRLALRSDLFVGYVNMCAQNLEENVKRLVVLVLSEE